MRRPARTRGAGSAAVEFVLLAPSVLVFAAFVWDLRAFVAHRTDLAREVYVIAELIAAEVDGDPLAGSPPPLVGAFIERFAAKGSGSLDIAVVRRDDRGAAGTGLRRDGTPCPPFDPGDRAGTWCPPVVAVRWPGGGTDGFWARSGGGTAGGDCANATRFPPLPRPSTASDPEPFGAAEPMLCGEPADPADCRPAPADNEADWVSRQMEDREWWVVVDVCLHPGPGTFTGPLIQAGMNALDFGSFAVRHRGAWRSVFDLGDCAWCTP